MDLPNGPLQPVCSWCGGTDVSREAFLSWDMGEQAWVLGTIFDDGHCHRCGCARRLDFQPYDRGDGS